MYNYLCVCRDYLLGAADMDVCVKYGSYYIIVWLTAVHFKGGAVSLCH